MGQSLIDNLIEYVVRDKRRKVIIPDGTTEIKSFAYSDWKNLKTVVIPESVDKIGLSAFEACESLTDISMPKSVKIMQSCVFLNCSKLNSINMPSDINHIPAQTFEQCTSLSSVTLPKDIEEIGMSAFEGCTNLKNITLPIHLTRILHRAFARSGLTDIVIPDKVSKIEAEAFQSCNFLKTVKLPTHIKSIGDGAFEDCPITKLTLPYGIRYIGKLAFSNNELEELLLPTSIKEIDYAAFSNSLHLKKVVLPEGLKKVEARLFKDSPALEHVELPSTILSIEESAFEGCESLSNIVIPHNIKRIEHSAFAECISLQKISLPKSIKEIGYDAFANCKNLSEVSLYPLTKCGTQIFQDDNFRFVYRDTISGKLIFTKDIIKEETNTPKLELYPLSLFYSTISNFDSGKLAIEGNIDKYSRIVSHLAKCDFVVSNGFLNLLENKNMLHKVGRSIDFSQFASEIPLDLFKLRFARSSGEEKIDVLKFATVLGCFSREKIKDKNGKETGATIGQKASSLFANICFYSGKPYFPFFHDYFDSLDIKTPISQSFLEFLSQKDGRGYYNITMLQRLDEDYPDIFANTMNNWSTIESYRNTLDENGLPTTITWEDAIIKFYNHKEYKRITPQNEDMAKVFGSKGIDQYFFDMASQIRENSRENNMRAHILSTTLKEESVLDSIEKVKCETAKILADSKANLDSLYSKKFTYEMLDKYDPRNAIIGIYCSCCGTITSGLYGEDIAKATMTTNDTQNLVVKNERGEIIAKGTMYVNERAGYIVINDFELNRKYRKHEDIAGRYNVKKDHKEEIERNEIFDTFMRGIHAFVKEYDKEHPDKPIKQVNVGWGYNRLKAQCEKFKKATRRLEVPVEYKFIDSKDIEGQRILYKRNEKEMERNE